MKRSTLPAAGGIPSGRRDNSQLSTSNGAEVGMLRKAIATPVLALLMVIPAWAADNAKCLMCHSATGFSNVKAGRQVSLHVEAEQFAASVHAKKSCVDCHIDFAGQTFPHKQTAEPVDCTRCHHVGNTAGAPSITPMTQYADSVHGMARKHGDKDAPTCKDCHGTHGIRTPSDPKSSVNRMNITDTCGKCHLDSSITKRHTTNMPTPAKIKLYRDSVHGKAVRNQGMTAAAVCTDCHGDHTIQRPTEPASSV